MVSLWCFETVKESATQRGLADFIGHVWPSITQVVSVKSHLKGDLATVLPARNCSERAVPF